MPHGPALPRHPLADTGRMLLSDLFSTLAFALLYAATRSLTAATGIAIGLGLAQVAWLRWRGADLGTIQWLGLILVIGFGSATLPTRTPTFVLLKPTLVYLVVGAVMLRPGWMIRCLPAVARDRGWDVAWEFDYVWAALMFATAIASLGFALLASPASWAWFVGVFPIASKLALVLVQCATTRRVVGRRLAAAGP